jgi:branched-chain amino acid transport system permease protein
LSSIAHQSSKDKILLLAVLTIAFVLPLVVTSPSTMQFLILLLFYAYLTSSWNLVGGFAGVLPLGHAAFVALGAYTSTLLYLQYGLSPWLGMLVGGVVAAVVGIIIGIPTLKMRGAYFALATIAFAEAIRVLIQNTSQVGPFNVNGPRGLLINLKGSSFAAYQFTSKASYYYIMLVLLLMVLGVTVLLMRSKLGYYLSAGGEEPEAAQALGVNVAKYKLLAMALSCFFTALAGTFYAQLMLYISPQNICGLNLSFEIAFIALIGGRGTILGPVLGALLLRPVNELTRVYLGGLLPGMHLVIFGLILVLVMIYQPRGIQEPLTRLYRRLTGGGNDQDHDQDTLPKGKEAVEL